jgi:hypothetical protein
MDAGVHDIISKTDSTIIILMIVLVSCLVALRPIIKIWLATKEKQQDRLIAVIQANTDVNASLKTVLEEDRKRCAECQSTQLSMFKQIQETQDITNMKLVEIHTVLSTKEAAKNGEN